MPLQRYRYEHPDGTGYEDSPFASIWFLHFGKKHGEVILSAWESELTAKKTTKPASLMLVRSIDDLAASGKIPTAKRPSSKQRKRLQKRAASSELPTAAPAAHREHPHSKVPAPACGTGKSEKQKAHATGQIHMPKEVTGGKSLPIHRPRHVDRSGVHTVDLSWVTG